MGISEFRFVVFSDVRIKPRVIQGASDLMNFARQKRQSQSDDVLLHCAIEMFGKLGIYSKDFEPKLMYESEKFLSAWAEETSKQTTLAAYVLQCQELFTDEVERCGYYGLNPSTALTLQKKMEDILLDARQNHLLNAADISLLLLDDNFLALKGLYSLLQRRELEGKLASPFEAFIVKSGSDIVFDEEYEQDMVFRLLEFKRKLDRIWGQAFEANESLGHTLREAFESFINKSRRSNMTWGTDNPKPGEMIAKYVDVILKGGKKAIPTHLPSAQTTGDTKMTHQDMGSSSEDEDVEISKQLDQVLDLFRFVHGKAVFEAFYKRDLARRLLLGRSSSADAEKSMLSRLKSGRSASAAESIIS